jgi:hypothetical protein
MAIYWMDLIVFRRLNLVFTDKTLACETGHVARDSFRSRGLLRDDSE